MNNATRNFAHTVLADEVGKTSLSPAVEPGAAVGPEGLLVAEEVWLVVEAWLAEG